jgi:tetratricopeptide (TPR) repeat protein
MVNSKNIFKWNLVSIILLIAVSFALYINLLPNEFVFDDYHFIINNRWINDWRNLPDIFFSPVFSSLPADQIAKSDPNFYRPIFHIFLMFGYLISGMEPWGYRIVNIITHATISIIVFFIAKSLLREGLVEFKGVSNESPIIAFLAAMIFVTHPVQAEMVAWASGSNHLAHALFFLLSLYLYIIKKRYASAAAFFIALLSKETAIMLPPLLFTYEIVIKKRSLLPVIFWAKRALFFIIPFIAYFVMRLYSLGGMVPSENERILTPYLYIINLLPLLGRCVKKLVWPTDIAFYVYQMSAPLASLIDIRAIALIVLFLVLAFIVFKIRRTQTKISFCIIWIFLPLLPVLYFGWVQGAPVYADRFMYIPSVAYSILLALLVSMALGRLNTKKTAEGKIEAPYNIVKIALVASIVVVIALFSLETFKKTFVWRNKLTLVRDTLEKSPNYALFRFIYTQELSNRGMIDEAIEELKISIAADYNNPKTHNNLGVQYAKKNRLEEAKKEFEIALKVDPEYETARKNLENIKMIINNNLRQRQTD